MRADAKPNAGAPEAAPLTGLGGVLEALAEAAATLAGATTPVGKGTDAEAAAALVCEVSTRCMSRGRTPRAENRAALVKVVHCEDAGIVGVYGSEVIAARQRRVTLLRTDRRIPAVACK